MVSKIISGGQTGVDRAALDVAVEMGIPHGGWVPRDRKAEDGAVPEKYKVKETAGLHYSERTEKNIADSDGSLLISRGRLTGGSALTRELAVRRGKPWLHVDLHNKNAFIAAQTIAGWIIDHAIKILNVAGPRSSQDPDIYEKAKHLLKTVFYLISIETGSPDSVLPVADAPGNVDEAVKRIMAQLPLKERAAMAHLRESDLARLQKSLEEYIRKRFGLPLKNRALMMSCRALVGGKDISEQEASSLIIRALWKRLRETHSLRIIK